VSTELAIRARPVLPRKHRGYLLVRQCGRFFGVPLYLNPVTVNGFTTETNHPAALSAPTLDGLVSLIDEQGDGPPGGDSIGSCGGYELVRFRDKVYGVPLRAGRVDLDLAEERWRCGVIDGRTRDELEGRIRRAGECVEVEFAGWAPVFGQFGNCGRHPQFEHTAEPPAGYRFTCSAPATRKRPPSWLASQAGLFLRRAGCAAMGLWLAARSLFGVFWGSAGLAPVARARVIAAVFRLGGAMRRNGARLGHILNFLRTRHFQSQVMLASRRGLLFLPSVPFTYGQNPWVIEIEDITTLFFPFLHNGHTGDVRMADSPYLPVVKTLLEADSCKAIITHMRSTAEMARTLFSSERISAKVHHVPLGVRLPPRYQRHRDGEDTINLLFINSWQNHASSFFVRGGLDVLGAFSILHRRYPNLRLTIRSALPPLHAHYHRLLEAGWVRVIDRFLPPEEMEALHAESHIYLLPAARIHIVSLLQAMSHGLAVVTSDGWGIEEYVTHGRNALVVKGRYGKVTLADEQEGILREQYDPMFTPDAGVVDGIVDAVSRLVEDRQLRRRLGETARADVSSKYSLEQWNRGLKAVFDRVHDADAPRPRRLCEGHVGASVT
jgi:glycosyltransferase involved in cell wall biosynthesis